ncbi:conserved hypothetical protein [Coccidioides posadasii str. Silveira]|uniref:Uncharacterized protein n=2 Tax=Coccidioides posadasii TaxID=199306 RepID=E9DEF8_COCPS|nr:conserved hypothetical protein [Coccidioides posadasii str. Silveira]
MPFPGLAATPSWIYHHFKTIFQSAHRSVEDVQQRPIMYIPAKLTFRKMVTSEAPLHPKTPSVGLEAAGLVALAELTTIQERTALSGTSSLLDIFILAPGLHVQERAVELNTGEYPACAALTTGYVFRVENPATVFYLQRVGRTGKLTTLNVTRLNSAAKWHHRLKSVFISPSKTNIIPVVTYFMAVLWGIAGLLLLILSEDWWGVAVVGILMTTRLINFVVIRCRSELTWAGAPEPGEVGDLFILLSQDRWIRIQGLVDDLKAVTSGKWLRDQTTVESWLTAIAKVCVYLAAALASNVTQFGTIILLSLFIGSAGLLGLANSATHELHMHGRMVRVTGERRSYGRRLDLAKELTDETKRDDWAVRMGLIVKDEPTTNTVRVEM